MALAPEPAVLDVSPSGVAVVTLNRPEQRNAFDELTMSALAEHFETLKGADHVRIVFLRGAGEAFSWGDDIAWLRRAAAHSPAENEADALALARLLRRFHDLPQLTVALVHGAAMGSAVGLVAAADWAIATTDTRFRFPEVRLGLTPGVIAPYVIEAMGARATRGLFASALPFDAKDALRYGLVNELAADAAGLDSAMKRFAGLAMEDAPGAIAEAKALVRLAVEHRSEDALAKEVAKRTARRMASQELREGVAALLEKRRPEWDA